MGFHFSLDITLQSRFAILQSIEFEVMLGGHLKFKLIDVKCNTRKIPISIHSCC